MRDMMRILRRLEMVSRVGPITWLARAAATIENTAMRGETSVRTLERIPVTTHPRSALMVGPADQTVY